MLRKIKISENSKKIIYKLANDAGWILLIFFALALLAETVLPGTVSGRRGFEALIILIVANSILIVFLGKSLGVEIEEQKKKKAIYFLLFLGVLMIISSLIKFGWILMIPIFLLSILVFYFLYRLFFDKF